eukprot:3941740-Rhodomonas_salina.1
MPEQQAIGYSACPSSLRRHTNGMHVLVLAITPKPPDPGTTPTGQTCRSIWILFLLRIGVSYSLRNRRYFRNLETFLEFTRYDVCADCGTRAPHLALPTALGWRIAAVWRHRGKENAIVATWYIVYQ